jgi:hypothetical protein
MSARFAEALMRVAQFARLGALGDDGVWFAAGIEIYVTGSDWPIDRALSFAWSNECRSRRDHALRQFADRYCPEALLWRRAAWLGNEIRRYDRGAWRHDRNRADMPQSYVGAPRELLFFAFRENESIKPRRDMPLSTVQLEKVLSHCCSNKTHQSDPPIPTLVEVVSNAIDGDQNARQSFRKSDERWRRSGRR